MRDGRLKLKTCVNGAAWPGAGRRWCLALLLALVLALPLPSVSGAGPASAGGVIDSLPQVVRLTMRHYFESSQGTPAGWLSQWQVPGGFQPSRGVFVTLSRQGQTRACWGSLYPQQRDLVRETAYATLAALTKEYRHAPIRRGEWRSLKPQVTVVESVMPIASIARQNPLRDGLLLRTGSRSAVILPGEARDAHYQLVMARLKAGVQPQETYQLYRITARIYD